MSLFACPRLNATTSTHHDQLSDVFDEGRCSEKVVHRRKDFSFQLETVLGGVSMLRRIRRDGSGGGDGGFGDGDAGCARAVDPVLRMVECR